MTERRELSSRKTGLPENRIPEDFVAPVIPGFEVVLKGKDIARDESQVRVALKYVATGTPVPCNVVLKTTPSRIEAWKAIVENHFKGCVWVMKGGSDACYQTKVEGVSVSLYEKGTILIQGDNKCVDFCVKYLQVLKQEVDKQTLCLSVPVVHNDSIVIEEESIVSQEEENVSKDNGDMQEEGENALKDKENIKPKEEVKLEKQLENKPDVKQKCEHMRSVDIQCVKAEVRSVEVQCDSVPSSNYDIMLHLIRMEQNLAQVFRKVNENSDAISHIKENTSVESLMKVVRKPLENFEIKANNESIKTIVTESVTQTVAAVAPLSSNVQGDASESVLKTLQEIKGVAEVTKNKVEDQRKEVLVCKDNTKKCLESNSILLEIKENTVKCKENFDLTQKINGNTINTKSDVGQIKNKVNTIETKVESLSMPPLEGEDGDATQPLINKPSSTEAKPNNQENNIDDQSPNSDHKGPIRTETITDDDIDSFTPVPKRSDLRPEKSTMKVLIMHDSTTAGIDLSRMLGKDAEVESVQCGTISGALTHIRNKDSLDYDAFMTQIGINDLKTKSVNDAMSDMNDLVAEIKLRSTSPIVISQCLPGGTNHGELDKRCARFNVRCENSFQSDGQVHLIDNDGFCPDGFLNEQLYKQDKLHPNANGSRKLSFNIKKQMGKFIPSAMPYALRPDKQERSTGEKHIIDRSRTRGQRNGPGGYQSRHGYGKHGYDKHKRQYNPNYAGSPNPQDMNPYHLFSLMANLFRQ